MKTNVKYALFSCALLSTAFVSVQMDQVATTNSIGRNIASVSAKAPKSSESVTQISMSRTVSFVFQEVTSIKVTQNGPSKELSKKIDVLKAKLAKTTKEKNKITLEIIKKKKDLLTSKKSLAKLKKKLSKHDKEIVLQEAKIKLQEKDIEKLNKIVAEYDQAKVKITELENTLKGQSDENIKLKAENQELELKVTELTCIKLKQENLQKQIEKLSLDKAEVIEKLEAKLAELDANKDEKPKSSKDSNKDDDDDNEEKEELVSKREEVMLSRLTSLYAVIMQQQEQNNYLSQMRSQRNFQQRAVVSDFGLNADYGQYFERDIQMYKELEDMRRWSDQRGQMEFSGGSAFGYTSTLNDNFHKRYIMGSPMIYNQEQSYLPSSYNMNTRGFNFNTGPGMFMQRPQSLVSNEFAFASVAPMQPSFITM